MRRNVIVTGLLVFLSSSAGGQSSPLDNVQWLVGCWEMARGSMRVIERWAPPARGEMIGESWTTVNGADRENERLRLFVSRDTLVYAALPSGQALTEFRAIAAGPNEVTFANPAHDFPQRISYRRVLPDSLVARIEGDRAGRRNPVTFAYRKIDCPARIESPAALARASLQPRYDEMVAWELSYSAASTAGPP